MTNAHGCFRKMTTTFLCLNLINTNVIKGKYFSSGTQGNIVRSSIHFSAHTDYAISLRVAHLQVHFIKGELWPGPDSVPYTST